MARSALVLAALASAALPGRDPALAAALPPAGGAGGADVDEALVQDAGGGRWLVSAPRTPAAGAALDREVALLRVLEANATPGGASAAALPFAVARVAGTAALPEGGRAVVTTRCAGQPLEVEALGAGALAASLGRALAAVHELPAALAEDAGLPLYSAEQLRERRLVELDRAAGTGRVPARLLARWERALEDVGWWRFQPALVHGDLGPERVLVAGGSGGPGAPDGDEAVSALLGWGSACLGDPAEDLAWLAASAADDALAAVLAAHAGARPGTADPALADRARLSGEMALARYLLEGTTAQDAGVVEDAAAMLVDLDAVLVGAPPLATPGHWSLGGPR